MDNITVNLGKFGMRLGTHPSQLGENEYTFSLNSNIEDFNGNGMFNLQTEPSNLLCTNFPAGYRVIGISRDIVGESTYFFLTNPIVGKSIIGVINKTVYFNTVEDIEKSCGCDIKNILDEPLEGKEQPEICNFTQLINDNCNYCLNFDIRYPIFSTVIKNEKSGKRLYFTDNHNPPRYIDLDNIELYNLVDDGNCGEDPTTTCSQYQACEECDDCTQCINCDRMLVFPKTTNPCITVETLTNGGELRQGRYWFLMAGVDEQGNEITEYKSFTTPVDIFDAYNNTIDQTLLNKTTNYAIKLGIECNNFTFDHYKVAVIQATGLGGELDYFEVGVFPKDTTQIIYTSDNNKKRITLEQLYAVKPTWVKSEGLVDSNSRLYQYGLTAQTDLNLQPVVILMSAFLRWQTGVAKENLYKDGALDSKYGGYMRNENYTWVIDFSDDEGYTTPEYILTHRPASAGERELVFNGNINDTEDNSLDVISVLKQNPPCDNERLERWEFYNTASVLEDPECLPTNIPVTNVTVRNEFRCEIIVDSSSGEYTMTFTKPDNFTTLKNFINANKNQFGIGGLYEGADEPGDFLNNIFTATYTDSCDLNEILCEGFDNNTLESEFIFIDNITGINETNVPRDIINYVKSNPPLTCNTYKAGSDPSTGKELDPTGTSGVIFDHFGGTSTVYVRNTPVNELCSTALSIGDGNTGYHLNYLFEADWTDLQTAYLNPIATSPAAGRWFTTKIHKKGIWFEGSFGSNTSQIIEFTKGTECSGSDDLEDNVFLRYSIFNGCPSSGDSPVDTGIFDTLTGLIISIDASDYTTGTFKIVVDAPLQDVSNPISYVGSAYINPPCSCFSIKLRDEEIESTTFTFTHFDVYKEQVWTADCLIQIPQPDDCTVYPYQTGKFGYYESTITYPDNQELFNARNLVVRSNEIPSFIKDEFEDYFVTSTGTGNRYVLNEDTNLTCQPIRLYKFPDNQVSPFMYEQTTGDFLDTVIFPIGVHLSNDVINYFLKVASDSGLISQERKDKLKSYRIKRIDRSLQKSIVSKGLLYDTYKYSDENNEDIFYANYPYNCLGADGVIAQREGLTNIQHPFNSAGNNRYMYHGPETHFNQPPPFLPSEVIYEGTQWGKSIGKFPEVLDHPKYVILGREAYVLASILATTEVALETAITLGTAYLEYAKEFRFAAVTGDSNPFGIALVTPYVVALTAATVAFNAVYKVGQRRFEWLETFKNLGKPRNFAHYYTSKGWYNSMSYERLEGNTLRGLAAANYLKGGGRYSITEKGETSITKINNEDRESSVYLSFGEDFEWLYNTKYINYDNYSNRSSASRRFASEANACDGREFTSNIASDYVALRNYLFDQYGDVYSMKFIDTGYCGKLDEDNPCDIIWGGDTRISRMSLKRKLPLFLVNALGQADQTPFAYNLYNNIGQPNFYINFDIEITDSVNILKALFPDVGSEGFYDCGDNGPSGTISDFYIKPPHKFYLFYYGIPQFLVESDINLNYRYARREPKEWFFPNGQASDYTWWTQEKNVSIKYDNEYNYNPVYTRNVVYSKNRLLPSNFSQEKHDKRVMFPNGVIASQPDNTESNYNDPYLNYKPFDFYEFPFKYGKLISIDKVESGQLLARFENQSALINSIDVLAERLNANNSQLGVGIFGQRHIEFNISELGYGGSQSKISVHTEFGRFWVDANRGQVFVLDPGGKGQTEISSFYRNGKPRDTRQFFKEHLPFKILRDFPDLKIDNPFNMFGITMGWDSKHRRVFITKKDYKVKPEYKDSITFTDGRFTIDESYIDLTDTQYFEDYSWTLAYSPVADEFISFYSFTPNYYIPYHNYFQTGYNSADQSSLWSHLLSNKSYRVFNGKLYPWTIELASKNELHNKILGSLEYWLESQRYYDEYDFSVNNEIGFNKAWIYNNTSGTGNINLVNSKEVPYLKQVNYPKTNVDSLDIIVTESDKKWTLNGILNKVAKETANVPQWLVKNIYKVINPKAFNYRVSNNDRLRGDWFLVRLEETKESRYHMIFKWLFNKTDKDI